MRSKSTRLKSAQRFAAAMLLALMVYQLGACPCGCIEHNAWAQMLGFVPADDAEHHLLASTDGIRLTAPDSHDCTGEAKANFLDNARDWRAKIVCEPDTLQQPIAGSIRWLNSVDAQFRNQRATVDRDGFDAALARPSLQVYRL